MAHQRPKLSRRTAEQAAPTLRAPALDLTEHQTIDRTRRHEALADDVVERSAIRLAGYLSSTEMAIVGDAAGPSSRQTPRTRRER